MDYTRKFLWRTTLIYLTIGLAWIYFSDSAVLRIFSEEVRKLNYFQTVKGWFYVVSTTVLLYFLLRMYAKEVKNLAKEKDERASIQSNLAYQEKFFQSIIDHAYDGIVVYDRNLVIHFVSPSARLLLGYLPGELKGFSLSKIGVFSEGQDEIEQQFTLALGPTEKRLFRAGMSRSDRREIRVECVLTAMTGNQGELLFVLNFHDVTELELREQTDQFKSEVLQIIATSDRKLVPNELAACFTRFLEVDEVELWTGSLDNEKLKLSGYKYANATRTPRDLFAEKGIGFIGEVWSKGEFTYFDVENFGQEVVSDFPPGCKFVYACPLKKGDTLVGIAVCYSDIPVELERFNYLTAQVFPFLIADIERDRATSFFRSLLEVVEDLICLFDKDGRLKWANRRFGEELNADIGGVLNSKLTEFVVPEHHAIVEDAFQKLRNGVPVERFEARLLGTSDETSWFSWDAVLLENERVVIASAKDVSEIKRNAVEIERANQALKERADALEESNSVLERYAYIISHDLQEPLRMVKGFLELLHKNYEENLDERGQKYIQFASDGAKRMSSMINGLLSYARITGGQNQFSEVALDEVFNDVLVMLKLELERTGAEIHREPLPVVKGVRSLFLQLFLNIISNSLKYKGENSVRIDISYTKNEDFQVISIQDNGLGIPQEDLEHVFQVFGRVERDELTDGLGLGLAIARRVVQIHNGTIEIDNNPDRGITVRIKLPVRDN
jgi:PAS domain S-box-containing protein